jgi:uncharacterized protein (TIGR03437 family)
MGYSFPVRVVFALSLFGEVAAFGTPQLQLSQTALFAVAPPQKQSVAGMVFALNVGDGNLKLSLSSPATWLSAALVKSKHGCHSYSNAKQCFEIEITVDTTGLPNGVITANVDVSAQQPAVDAPQNIVVTMVVGGPTPLDIYAPPTGKVTGVVIPADTNTFSVNLWQPVNPGVQLTVVEPMEGTWPFINREFLYEIEATVVPGTPVGLYDAAYSISGLASAAENATVPVYIHVTNLPIAVPSSNSLSFSSSTGSAPQSQQVTFSNAGLGTLQIKSAKVDSSWLSAAVGSGNVVTVSADPSKLLPGSYTGNVTVLGNAANPIVLSVDLTVTGVGPPKVTGVSGVTQSQLPLGEFVTITGSNFTTSAAQSADPTKVLPTAINGTQVVLGTEAAPLLSVAYGSITFQVPYDAVASYLQVVDGGATSDTFPIQIVPCAPVITSVVDANGVRVDVNNSSAYEPATVDATSPIKILGHGFGETSPPAPSGTPIPTPSLFGQPAYTVPTQIQFWVGNAADFQSASQSAQLTPGLIGSYQIPTTVPSPPSSLAMPVTVNLSVRACGRTSNTLVIRVK